MKRQTLQKGAGWYWLAGFLVGWTHLFSPVHELGHVLVAMLHGYGIATFRWSYTEFYGQPTILILIAGYLFSLLVFVAAAALFARNWHIRTAVFCIGHASTQLVFACVSRDYLMIEQGWGWIVAFVLKVLFFVGGVWFLTEMSNRIFAPYLAWLAHVKKNWDHAVDQIHRGKWGKKEVLQYEAQRRRERYSYHYPREAK